MMVKCIFFETNSLLSKRKIDNYSKYLREHQCEEYVMCVSFIHRILVIFIQKKKRILVIFLSKKE